GDTKLELDAFELVASEWKLVQQLCDVLRILKHATSYFSRDMPNLAVVIPAMDHIDEYFATEALNTTLSPAIRASISTAKRTLNRYYNLTDTSEVYCITMVLHPRHKLDYFKNANWESDWINTA
ncbi:hypothetical protein DENSPDRAFT_757967, partial [Dentipellis sp. KUC8613]